MAPFICELTEPVLRMVRFFYASQSLSRTRSNLLDLVSGTAAIAIMFLPFVLPPT
ncbi:unnamed protein product [Sphenostylis stenocarpa]|uniref:Uncharacterized protein n=1 Tax=Sphenostylis stenocarpa TaxID=92480 RepID=A0AA86SIE3_9FABA|nr:unnamed protein product [Sphenostylis stenocarpa]